MISDELREEARQAFAKYEKVLTERIVKRPGWRLGAAQLEKVLASGDEARVRAYIEDLHANRRDLEDAIVA